jgi:hypothetical protein
MITTTPHIWIESSMRRKHYKLRYLLVTCTGCAIATRTAVACSRSTPSIQGAAVSERGSSASLATLGAACAIRRDRLGWSASTAAGTERRVAASAAVITRRSTPPVLRAAVTKDRASARLASATTARSVGRNGATRGRVGAWAGAVG